MVIQHNIAALNAYNKTNFNVTATQKASEKLASGFRINCAADDASGLAVSEKMRSQIRGLKQAARNCQDGVNLIQTFEGALSQSHEILRRCTELAEEVANGTYDDPTDRAAAQLEYNELCKEIDAISDTDFNGLTMLNGGTLAALREKYKGLNWLNPGDVDWKEGTLINQTDPYDPGVSMEISKMPGYDSLTMATDDEVKALRDLEITPISVDLSDGKTKFYFDCSPEPDNLSIETRGTMGIVSLKTAGSVVEIAKVTVPDVSRTLKTTSVGYWGSSTNNSSVSAPTEKNVDFSVPNFYLGTNASADVKGSNYASTDQMRKDYNEWLENIPNVQFTVKKDDLDKFTIPEQYKNQVLDWEKDKVYNRGDTITVVSKVDNGTKTVHTPVKVDWNVNFVKPGDTQSVTRGGYSSTSGTRDFGTYVDEKYAHHYNAYTFGTVSSDTKESRFLKYGSEYFDIRYQETSVGAGGVSSGTWTITVSNFDVRENYPGAPNGLNGNTLTLNTDDNVAGVDYFLGQLGLSRSTLTDGLTKIHAANNQIPSDEKNPDGSPRHIFTIQNNSLYNMSVTTAPSTPSTTYFDAWYSGSSEYHSLSLGKYDADNPGVGIDYDLALAGNYTYHNDHIDEGVQGDPGYWTNPKGERVVLEDEGIHLPTTSVWYHPLHNGFTITVEEIVKGPSGKLTGVPKLEFGAKAADEYYMAYSDTLILQTNSRSKDAVQFTFVYHTQGQGDLECNLNCSSAGLGLKEIDLVTQENANKAVDQITNAINKVSMVRACFGSVQNRLEHKLSNISVSTENVTSSEAYIRDADMPEELMKFTKSQILSQASQSIQAQTNQFSVSVLQLLK